MSPVSHKKEGPCKTAIGAAARPAEISAAYPISAVRVRFAPELCGALQQAARKRLSVDATELDRILDLDPASGLVEVQASASWGALAARLREAGCQADAFAAAEDLPPTMGESAAVNAPGADGQPIAAHVEALTFVTADGDLRRAARHGNREFLQLVLGDHGAFGMLYSLTLRLSSLARSARDAEQSVEQD
ncbi:MAG TPA: FAD-binding protein [Burkholderiales bacterium]|nr:FAD-binding protein [Burkholderiales bacterium]